jgi:hypothetical protein
VAALDSFSAGFVMSAALRTHIVVIAYWLVIIPMAAFFLRQACSLCRASLPSWRRAMISVVVVTLLAYLAFDFTAYLVMRSLDGIVLRVPPWYSYVIWFHEPIGLKWLIISQAGAVRYLPIALALVIAGILQVLALNADVTFGWGFVIVILQTVASIIGAYIVSLLFGVVLEFAEMRMHGEPSENVLSPHMPAEPGQVEEER